ncbi:hypothetical protein DUNSADRAFT_12882 [Dunaliella salina]|uniref:Uncharacterized protein n=1 Tax=Dunaliella salina TaxID=3046 RepID=A0ABQ7H3N1_DUNSA|nr:hypothetical protein DUNSADRAFT_12882 [Dunaliella salina]|eukprot:KAF5841438.1 hypothetical protein DUNSADRAFT_12882 [Dunaliella salina]
MQARHDRGRMLMLLRFWFRWSVVRQSERMGFSPPLFRPPMLIWDAWLSNHHRSKHLEARIPKLHWNFHVRQCFQFWYFFTARNKRMRLAFMASAAYQIEIILRQCVNGLKANWQQARLYRRMRKNVLREWHHMAQRNVQVRAIAAKVHVVSSRTYLKQSFRMLREWTSMSNMLSASGCIQMWQRRTLCLIPLFAWTGDNEHMWFCSAWSAWRDLVLGRLRFRCMVGMHIERQGLLGRPLIGMDMELWFRAWAKAAKTQARARAQVAKFHRVRHRKQLREALEQQSAGREDPKDFARLSSQLSGSSSQGGNVPRERQSSFAGSRQGSMGRLSTRSSMIKNAVIDSSSDEEDLSWLEPDVHVRAAEDFELQNGSVDLVNLSDLPRVSPYRPLHSRSFILATTAPKPTQWYALRDHIKNLAADLKGLDGRFRPGLINKQFLFEHLGSKADSLEPAVQRFLSTGREESMKNWGAGRIVCSPTTDRRTPITASPSSMPTALDDSDPWFWQRMVGLMACSLQPHPETPLNNLANVGFLPFAEEIGAVKRLQYRDRMRLPIVDEEMIGEDEEAFRPRAHRRSGEAFVHAPQKEAKPDQVVSWDGVLEPEARGLMWIYKLAEAEEVLETSTAWLMKLNAKDLPILYQVLVNQRAPSLGPSTALKLTIHNRAFRTNSSRISSGSVTGPSDVAPPEYKLPDNLSCCKQVCMCATSVHSTSSCVRALAHVDQVFCCTQPAMCPSAAFRLLLKGAKYLMWPCTEKCNRVHGARSISHQSH